MIPLHVPKLFFQNKFRTQKHILIFFPDTSASTVQRQVQFLFQALNFPVESFGLLNDLFPLPLILDAGYPVFDLHLADVLFDVILPSVLGVFLEIFWLEVSN